MPRLCWWFARLRSAWSCVSFRGSGLGWPVRHRVSASGGKSVTAEAANVLCAHRAARSGAGCCRLTMGCDARTTLQREVTQAGVSLARWMTAFLAHNAAVLAELLGHAFASSHVVLWGGTWP